MGSKRKTIIREYHSQKNEYIALGDLISSMLKEAVKKANLSFKEQFECNNSVFFFINKVEK